MFSENNPQNDFGENKDTDAGCSSASEEKFNGIIKSGSIISSSGEETIHCLTIIGQIEGHYLLGDGQKATKYEHIIPLLVSIEESNEIDGMLMILNTMGGDVEAGLAIAEMVASMTKPTVSLVLGGGHSIGVPLAVSSQKSLTVNLLMPFPSRFNYIFKFCYFWFPF